MAGEHSRGVDLGDGTANRLHGRPTRCRHIAPAGTLPGALFGSPAQQLDALADHILASLS
jgi:hypothetical protein